jgi:hypothetical protein
MRFSATVKICLIPCRQEFMPQLVELFWTSDDYIKFKNDAVSELRSYLTSNGITAKEAIFRLYQPPVEVIEVYERPRTDEGAREVTHVKDHKLLPLIPATAIESLKKMEEEEIHRYNSKEDDDPTYGDDIEGLKKFSNSGKTDIELNAERKMEVNVGEARRGSLTKMPTKTPAGGSADNQHIWAVTWKPQ